MPFGGSWASRGSMLSSSAGSSPSGVGEDRSSVLGSCPSFNDFSLHTYDDVSKEYENNNLRRASVPIPLRQYSSVNALPEKESGMSRFVSMPLSSFRGFSTSASKTSRAQHKIDGLDYYDFVDLVRGSPT